MSVELALQKAIVVRLKAADVAADRIYDRVPPDAVLPYVRIRSIQALDDSADCVDGFEVFVDLDVWSDAVGKPEAQQIAAAVRSAISFQALPLDEPYALVEITHRTTSIDDAGDQLQTRARLTFRALVESV